MKTIGLIGGMSWESSAVYYKLLNEIVKEKLGGFHSCKNIMLTVDFAEIEELQSKEDWNALDKKMVVAAKQLESAGADIILICANTMHLCEPAISKQISIPVLHIADATGQEIVKQKMKKVALLGTKYTMEKDFYKEYISNKFGIEVIIPGKTECENIHRIIYEELVQGKILNESRKTYIQIIENLKNNGAEGVILGCTEIPQLISNEDVSIPVFDTTKIHAKKAVEWALTY